MTRFVLRRLGASLITLLAMSVVIFLLVRLVGDPTDVLLPPEATRADRLMLQEQLGLDRPLVVQYAIHLRGLLRGDLGKSYYYGRPALDVVLTRLTPSLLLTGAALSLALLAGVPLGILAAVRPGGWSERIGHAVAMIGQSAPPFLMGLLLVRLFSVGLGWLPTSGYDGPRNLILPALVLGFYSESGLFRLTQASMTEVLRADFVTLARIKGVPAHAVVLRHALRNAALPIVTFAGSQFGILIGGAVSIETVFAWPGVGKLIVDSIAQLDYTVVQAAALVTVTLFIAINLAVDLAYGAIDPRIRHAA